MKTILLLTGAGLLLLSLQTPQQKQENPVIEIPITLVDGFGTFSPSFGILSSADPESEWGRCEYHELKGLPTDWKSLQKDCEWMDAWQFAYQSWKNGKMDTSFFESLKESWSIDLDKRTLSDKEIRCFVYVLYGKNKSGESVYMIDTDNDLDFSDETVYKVSKWIRNKTDSLAKIHSQQVKYETIRNGKVEWRTVPMLILENDYLLTNKPQHAEAEFQGVKIHLNSQNFAYTSYEHSRLCIPSEKDSFPPVFKEKEFIRIAGKTYRHLGVNIEKQVLLLEEIRENILEGTQVGFIALPFSGTDFSSEKAINLDSYKGKFLYLEFWGTWCGPCVKEIPNLKTAYKNTDHAKIEFLGIARDNEESLRSFLKKNKITWPQILDSNSNGICKIYNVSSFPSSFLINPEGKIVARDLRGEHLTDTLNYYLNQ